MVRRMFATACLLVLVAVFAPRLIAAEQPAQPQGMPEMGAPREIKAMAGMVGAWKAHTKFKMDPSQPEWQESDGEMVCEFTLDSCALMARHTGEMMGMRMKGLNITNYNRELKAYQTYWIDNMWGLPSFYEGQRDSIGKKVVYTGTDIMLGQKFFSRMTITTLAPTSLLMEMEMSQDGKAWVKSMEVAYTKVK